MDQLSLEFLVGKMEIRDEDFAVHYDFTWQILGEQQPVTVGNFIVRYWAE